MEYYFGYKAPEGDLACEDWRSRDPSRQTAGLALAFFERERVAFWSMENADGLVGNPKHENGPFALAKPSEAYVVYLPKGGTHLLDLTGVAGSFRVSWYDPRLGGPMVSGAVTTIDGGRVVPLGAPPSDPGEDWVALVRR